MITITDKLSPLVELKQLKFVIITRQLLPCHCGIGDYTVCLANALRKSGHKVILIAEQGCANSDVAITSRGWDTTSLQKLFLKIEALQPDHIMLQFTPLMYASPSNKNGLSITKFWQACNKSWETTLIVHETYFWEWWYPPSWLKGLRQRQLLKRLVTYTQNTFSASQPLVDEIQKWRKDKHVTVLPIGSNISLVPSNRDIVREQHGILSDDIVLVLFGGGNSLKWLRGHVNAVDKLLNNKDVKVHWLLLGGVPKDWFNLSSPVISPGRLPESEISAWLQASDIFLMPHFAGLCAKRGTLITAMLHALPVVGTRSEMTDIYWETINGVDILPRWAASSFAESVFELAIDKCLRQQYGSYNREYFDKYFSWKEIAHKLLVEII